jgi:hypothetical protein
MLLRVREPRLDVFVFENGVGLGVCEERHYHSSVRINVVACDSLDEVSRRVAWHVLGLRPALYDGLTLTLRDGPYCGHEAAFIATIQDQVTKISLFMNRERLHELDGTFVEMLQPHAFPKLTALEFRVSECIGSEVVRLLAPRVSKVLLMDSFPLEAFVPHQKLTQIELLSDFLDCSCEAMRAAARMPSVDCLVMQERHWTAVAVRALEELCASRGARIVLGTAFGPLMYHMIPPGRPRVWAVARWSDMKHSHYLVWTDPPPAPLRFPFDRANHSDALQGYLDERGALVFERDALARACVLAMMGATANAAARFVRADGDHAVMWRVVRCLLPRPPILDWWRFVARRDELNEHSAQSAANAKAMLDFCVERRCAYRTAPCPLLVDEFQIPR